LGEQLNRIEYAGSFCQRNGLTATFFRAANPEVMILFWIEFLKTADLFQCTKNKYFESMMN